LWYCVFVVVTESKTTLKDVHLLDLIFALSTLPWHEWMMMEF